MTTPNNTIFVGAKPPMNYVLAIVTQFNGGEAEVAIKARGRAITRAVDVAEIVRNRFLEDVSIGGIRIGTERITDHKGRNTNVSNIEIRLVQQPSVAPTASPELDAPKLERGAATLA